MVSYVVLHRKIRFRADISYRSDINCGIQIDT